MASKHCCTDTDYPYYMESTDPEDVEETDNLGELEIVEYVDNHYHGYIQDEYAYGLQDEDDY